MKSLTLCLLAAHLAAPIEPATVLDFETISDACPHESIQREAVTGIKASLNHYCNQKVKIRAFAYCDLNQQWILSPEPQLKTCCIRSKKKIYSQIHLREPLHPEVDNHAVTLQGRFFLDPEEGPDGELWKLFSMDEIELIHQTSPMQQGFALGTLLLLGLIPLSILRARKKR